jgi:hypothetical protein
MGSKQEHHHNSCCILWDSNSYLFHVSLGQVTQFDHFSVKVLSTKECQVFPEHQQHHSPISRIIHVALHFYCVHHIKESIGIMSINSLHSHDHANCDMIFRYIHQAWIDSNQGIHLGQYNHNRPSQGQVLKLYRFMVICSCIFLLFFTVILGRESAPFS